MIDKMITFFVGFLFGVLSTVLIEIASILIKLEKNHEGD